MATIEANALIARENASLERGLLPAPVLRGDDFTAASRYEPGRSHALLSGDFYDVVQTADSTVHVILGDVSGHGAAEAALAVHLRVAWRTAVLCGKTQLEQLCILERSRGEDILLPDPTSDAGSLNGGKVNVVPCGKFPYQRGHIHVSHTVAAGGRGSGGHCGLRRRHRGRCGGGRHGHGRGVTGLSRRHGIRSDGRLRCGSGA